MVLASAEEMSLVDLAQLADRIMDVAIPSMSAINMAPLTSEVEQLRVEVAHLKGMLSSLQLGSTSARPSHHHSHS